MQALRALHGMGIADDKLGFGLLRQWFQIFKIGREPPTGRLALSGLTGIGLLRRVISWGWPQHYL